MENKVSDNVIEKNYNIECVGKLFIWIFETYGRKLYADMQNSATVSYTHLDVYKRQVKYGK